MDFLNEIKQYAQRLEKAATWHDSKRSVGFVERSNEKDYVYEFYCYLRILVDLMNNYQVEFIKGSKHEFNFPQKPGLKENFPRFHLLRNGEVKFHYCAGTRIEGKSPQQNQHPDVSIQVPEGKNYPKGEHVVIIMDAKFSENENKRLGRGEVYKFFAILDQLNLPRKPRMPIEFDQLKLLEADCLLTNCLPYEDEGHYSIDKGFKEIYYFTTDKEFREAKP